MGGPHFGTVLDESARAILIVRPLSGFFVVTALILSWTIWRATTLGDSVAGVLAAQRAGAEEQRAARSGRAREEPAFFALEDLLPAPAGIPRVRRDILLIDRQGRRHLWHSGPAGSTPSPARTKRLLAAVFESAQEPADPPSSDRPGDSSRARHPSGYKLASAGYDALEKGDRRGASASFAAALRYEPGHENAALWRRELHALSRRWSAEAYTLIRNDGVASLAGTQPLLGGSQSAIQVRYTLDPLASRPLQLVGRFTAAHEDGAAEAAAGIAWRPFGRNWPEVALERRFAIASGGRDAWQARISGGYTTPPAQPLDVRFYGDAGIAGAKSRDLFASGQAFAGWRIDERVSVGAGGWGGVQEGTGTLHIVEGGPALRARIPLSGANLSAEAAYRFRLTGSAGNRDGATLTVSASY